VSDYVLDASALLALLNDEPGAAVVRRALGRSAMSAANLAEVVGKLELAGMPHAEAITHLGGLRIDVVPFDRDQAYLTGRLRPSTRTAGLGLGDCACLALAEKRRATVLTADRAWAGLELGVKVRPIR
jgi:PIN domain nuclease of toxin-antitoxin system